MIAELVAAGSDVPGFRDELDRGERRVLAQRVEKAAVRIEAARFASERDAEVEAKAIDVELVDPVAQRVHDELDHARMRGVNGIAAAGVVDALARIVGQQPVIVGVVEAAQRQGRAEFAFFAGVVVDHVEDHFDAGRVQALDGIFHLAQLPAREIAWLGRKERQRVVAPVVLQLLLDQTPVLQERVHWQQLDGCDAELD